ncbi:hypothetical protein Bca4012_092646 [Brassica carinata]
MTQRARVTKSHELPKVVSCQRVQVTKRYEIQRVANIKRYEDQKMPSTKGCMFQTVSIDAGSVRSLRWFQELRMVLVKPRSREGSVSERLCSVWLDDAREEMVIVYEIVHKLCIGSHVSK